MRRRPLASEYVEYYHRYVSAVPDGDIVDILRGQLEETTAFLRRVPKEKVDYRYAPGKWSLKEVVGHVIDMEWVFTARALHFARGVKEPLPGVDQDEFVAAATHASTRPMETLIDQYRHLRSANLLLFDGFDEATMDRSGVASGNKFTVRAFPYIISGHERHHMGVIREKYLG